MSRRNKAHVSVACVPCKMSHIACDHRRPCRQCERQGKEAACVDAVHAKRGRPKGTVKSQKDSETSSSRSDSPEIVPSAPDQRAFLRRRTTQPIIRRTSSTTARHRTASSPPPRTRPPHSTHSYTPSPTSTAFGVPDTDLLVDSALTQIFAILSGPAHILFHAPSDLSSLFDLVPHAHHPRLAAAQARLAWGEHAPTEQMLMRDRLGRTMEYEVSLSQERDGLVRARIGAVKEGTWAGWRKVSALQVQKDWAGRHTGENTPLFSRTPLYHTSPYHPTIEHGRASNPPASVPSHVEQPRAGTSHFLRFLPSPPWSEYDEDSQPTCASGTFSTSNLITAPKSLAALLC